MIDFTNIENINKLLEEFPNSSANYLAAKWYIDNGDYKKAIPLCENSLNFYPQYLTGYILLLDSYISISDYQSAKKILQKAYNIFPNHWVFKPFEKKLEEKGILLDDLFFDDAKKLEHTLEIDENEIETIVEEKKNELSLEHSDFDEYIKEAIIDNLDKEDNTQNTIINYPEEIITCNDFIPTEQINESSSKDEIINNLIEDEKITNDHSYIEPQSIKSTNNQYDIERELSQLLNKDELTMLTNQFPKIDEPPIIDSEHFIPPKLVSKTMAEVYESQGKYYEAIEIYKTLLQNKVISFEECDKKINDLQNKILLETKI